MSVVNDAIATLAQLKFFPSEPSVRASIAELIGDMCSTDEQVEWLAKRARNLYDEWPGPHELRAVMCSKFKPKDGIEADSKHPRYIDDGIPPERPQLPAPVMSLIEGEVLNPQPKIAEATVAIMCLALPTPKPTKDEIESSRRFFEERGVLGL